MKKWILLVIILAVIVGGWFLYLNDNETSEKVSITEAGYMDLKNSLEFSGEVVPQKMYSVMSETGGTIKNIYVAEGSKVDIGDPLFDLDSTEIESQLKEAELNYEILCETSTVMAQADAVQDAADELKDERAKVALALSQTTGYDYESLNEAFSDQLDESAVTAAASLSDLSFADDYSESSEESYSDTVSENEIALAELSVERLNTLLENMSYESLMEGTVLAVNINEGEVLSPAIAAMVIADTENLLISAYVYENDVGSLSLGMEVKIYTDDGNYLGTLTNIGEAASDVTGTSAYETMIEVEITPEEDFYKKPGAVVDVEIVLNEKNDVLSLPLDCITEDHYVYVVGENDVLEKRYVETGFQETFNVEILSGVSEGEMVVTSPQDVEEGQQVVYD